MARTDILAPVEVVSFTKDRTHAIPMSDPPFVTRWGGPARFDFSGLPSDRVGPEVVQPEETDPALRVGFSSGEHVWRGVERFREASVSVAGEAGMPVDAEGIQRVTFDLGEREIRTEEKRLVGNCTVIYPTIEYCREYLEFEFALTTVLNRGEPAPPDSPPPPVPAEIAEAPVIPQPQTYDWSAPDYEVQDVIPMRPKPVEEVVDLSAFRTPIRFAAGGTYIALGYAVTMESSAGGGSASDEIIANDTYITIDLLPGVKVGYNSPSGDVIRSAPENAALGEKVLATYVAQHSHDTGSSATAVTGDAGMTVWALNVDGLRALVASFDPPVSSIVKVEFYSRGQVDTTFGGNRTNHVVTNSRVFYRANSTGSGNAVLDAYTTVGSETPGYWPSDWPWGMMSADAEAALATYDLAADPVEWDSLDGIIENNLVPTPPTSYSPELVQTIYIDLATLQVVPPPT